MHAQLLGLAVCTQLAVSEAHEQSMVLAVQTDGGVGRVCTDGGSLVHAQ